MRQRNHGLRKLCTCPRRNWPKCSHSWSISTSNRVVGKHTIQFSTWSSASISRRRKMPKREADRIRSEIREGTFVRAADRRKAAADAAASHARRHDARGIRGYLPRTRVAVRERNKS